MAYIKDEVINEIRNNADIVDIVSSYLPLSIKGKNYVAMCPFHDDHNPSLIVSREKQIFSCFTCQTSGNVFKFVMEYEQVSFPEAIKIIANKIGYDLKLDNELVNEDKVNRGNLEIYNYAMKYYANNLITSDGFEARDYLEKRGIDINIIKEFNLGLALNLKDAFYKLSLKKNWDIDKLDQLGLINKVDANIYDTFINRIIIPIHNLKGEVVAFTGRIYHNEDNSAKYLNTKETKIFKKSEILFNYYNARKYIKDSHTLILVEGNMDAIKMSAKGFKNVIALMGVFLSKTQINIIKRLNCKVILMLDNDSAGLDSTLKNGTLLNNEKIDTYVVRLSEAKDPDEYLEKFGIEAMENNIKHALKFMDFKLETLKQNRNLNNPYEVIEYVKDVLSAINDEDDLTKELFISKISSDYDIDIDILKKGLNKNDEKKIERKKTSVPKTKLSKYQKASHRILYYMINDEKYINRYKTNLGYFKEKIERMLASEIIFYSNSNKINMADFATYLMSNKELYDFFQIIISESIHNINDEEFNSCINAILNIYKKEEINNLNEQIKMEMDINKKLELMQKLVDIKKEV
ncbi:DNA primase [bacterium]|nr:DNA primase [bacterium]